MMVRTLTRVSSDWKDDGRRGVSQSKPEGNGTRENATVLTVPRNPRPEGRSGVWSSETSGKVAGEGCEGSDRMSARDLRGEDAEVGLGHDDGRALRAAVGRARNCTCAIGRIIAGKKASARRFHRRGRERGRRVARRERPGRSQI